MSKAHKAQPQGGTVGRVMVISALIMLAGCQTCKKYPIACAVGTGLVVGSIAATIALQSHNHKGYNPPPKMPCEPVVSCDQEVIR
jgi:hypothetical protein